MSKFIMMSSCEKEQGKTIFSLIAAKKLSEENKVLLVDLSNSEKDSSFYLGVKDEVIYDVVDLIKDICSLEQSTIKIKKEEYTFDFLPAPRMKEKYDQLDLGHLKKIFMESNGVYDYVIIDGSSIIEDTKTASYEIIDLLLILSYSKVNDIKEIFAAYNIIGKDVKDIRLIINKINEKEIKKGELLNKEELEEILKIKIAGELLFSPEINSFEENFLENNNYADIEKIIDGIV